jgi:hypothetical protein
MNKSGILSNNKESLLVCEAKIKIKFETIWEGYIIVIGKDEHR